MEMFSCYHQMTINYIQSNGQVKEQVAAKILTVVSSLYSMQSLKSINVWVQVSLFI